MVSFSEKTRRWIEHRYFEFIVIIFFSVFFSLGKIEENDILSIAMIIVMMTILFDTGFIYTLNYTIEDLNLDSRDKLPVSYKLPMLFDFMLYIFSLLVLVIPLYNFYNLILFPMLETGITGIFLIISRFIILILFYIVLSFIRFIIAVCKSQFFFIIITDNTESNITRRVFFTTCIILLMILTFGLGLNNQAILFIINIISNPLDVLVFILILPLVLLLNSIGTIFIAYTINSLINFEKNIKFRPLLSFFFSKQFYEKIKTNRRIFSSINWFSRNFELLFILILCFWPITRFWLDFQFFSHLNLNSVSILYGIGEILLLASFLSLCWYILRAEDIILAVKNLRNLDSFNEFISFEKKVTLDHEGNENTFNEIKKKIYIQSNDVLDGIEGFLVGSLPIMFFSIIMFLTGSFFHNIENILDNSDVVFIPLILFSSLNALVITLTYQGGRQMTIREIKRILKTDYSKSSVELLKNFNLYIDKPDLITNAIIFGFPIVTLLLRIMFELR